MWFWFVASVRFMGISCVDSCRRVSSYESSRTAGCSNSLGIIREIPKVGVPDLGVRLLRIRLFRALYCDPLFSETPISHSQQKWKPQAPDIVFGVGRGVDAPCGKLCPKVGNEKYPPPPPFSETQGAWQFRVRGASSCHHAPPKP